MCFCLHAQVRAVEQRENTSALMRPQTCSPQQNRGPHTDTGECRLTCECLETQWRSTLRTLFVAARRMMNSLSQVLSELVNTGGCIKTKKEKQSQREYVIII